MLASMRYDIVSVAQNKAGRWMLTLNGSLVGDSRSQATKEAAIEYAKKITKNWKDVEYKFD